MNQANFALQKSHILSAIEQALADYHDENRLNQEIKFYQFHIETMQSPHTLESVIALTNILLDGLRFGSWPWSEQQVPSFLQRQAD